MRERLLVPPSPPRPVALVRVAWLVPFVGFLRRIGAPVERCLASAGLSLRTLDHPERLLPLGQASRFMEESAGALGLEHLGLLAGQETAVDALGVFGRLVCRAPTLREAIASAVRFMPAFSSGGRYWLTGEGSRLRLRHKLAHGFAAGFRQADQYSLMLGVNLVRLAAGRHWRPADVRLETSPASGFDDVDVMSDARVTFEQRDTSFAFPRELLGRTPAGTSGCWAGDDDVAAWQACAPASDFLGSLRQVVETMATPDYPRIGATAAAIGTSVRTLQRRLTEAGMSYERLLAAARLGMAVCLLEETDATILDIALDLGYSDHAHFTRAFRRWTGVSPREFRQKRWPGSSAAVLPGREPAGHPAAVASR